MNREKLKFLIAFLMVLLFLKGNAQQDPMYTQYMYNALSVNPAYAGSRGVLSLTGLVREQWVGMKESPSTQSLVIHSPVYNENMGLGLSVINDNAGPIHQTMLFADYSYSINVNYDDKLAFGLKAGVNVLQADLLSLNAKQEGDLAIHNVNNRLLPNVGFGMYYYSEKAYLGLSVPKLLEQTLKEYEDLSDEDVAYNSKERRHYFLMGGYVFDLTENLKFKPSFLLKAVMGAPLSIDLSANFLLNDRFAVGIAHRLNDSFSGLLQYYVTQQFRIGYAYDFTLTELRHYSSGSHEVMLGYDFLFIEDTRIHSPRFF